MATHEEWLKKLSEAMTCGEADWNHVEQQIKTGIAESPRKYVTMVVFFVKKALEGVGDEAGRARRASIVQHMLSEPMLRRASMIKEVATVLYGPGFLTADVASPDVSEEAYSYITGGTAESRLRYGLYVSLIFCLSPFPNIRHTGIDQAAQVVKGMPPSAGLHPDVVDLLRDFTDALAASPHLQDVPGKLAQILGPGKGTIASLSAAIRDKGPRACNDAAVMQELFERFAVTPEEVAQSITHISAKGWDYAPFAECLRKKVNQDFGWPSILQAFSSLSSKAQAQGVDVKLLIKIFERTMSRRMNISLACQSDKMRLPLLLKFANEGCDFQTERMQDDDGLSTGNEAWKSIDYVEALLNSCTSSNDCHLLKTTLKSGPLVDHPSVLLLSLCEVQKIPAHFFDLVVSVVQAVLDKDPAKVIPALHLSPATVETGLSPRIEWGAVSKRYAQICGAQLHHHPALLLSLVAVTRNDMLFLELMGQALTHAFLKDAATEWLEGVASGAVTCPLSDSIGTILSAGELAPLVQPELLARLLARSPGPASVASAAAATDGPPPPLPAGAGNAAPEHDPAAPPTPPPMPPATSIAALQGGLAPPPTVAAAAAVPAQQATVPDSEKGVQAFMECLYKERVGIEGLVGRVSEWRKEQAAEYECLIGSMFDELGYVDQFPAKELSLTARLFGSLVKADLLDKQRTREALGFVLNTLTESRKPNERQFALEALNCFHPRLPEWQNYCEKLATVPGLPAAVMQSITGGVAPPQQQQQQQQQPGPPGQAQQQKPAMVPQPAAPPQAASQPDDRTTDLTRLHQYDISTLTKEKSQQDLGGGVRPPTAFMDKCSFLVNNLDQSKMAASGAELKAMLKKEWYPYFSEYLVVKRISLEPNFHRLYRGLLEIMGDKELETSVMQASYSAVRTLLASPKITTNSSERSLLKNLGGWIGLQTIAQNKTLLARDLNLRELLIAGMEEGKLIAVAPFVSKVMENAAQSRIFKPPNPYIMGILEMLVDIHQLPDVKLTLKFEVEVLCKALSLDINELIDHVGKRATQQQKLQEIWTKAHNENPHDFHVQSASASGSAAGTPVGLGSGDASTLTAAASQAKLREEHMRHLQQAAAATAQQSQDPATALQMQQLHAQQQQQQQIQQQQQAQQQDLPQYSQYNNAAGTDKLQQARRLCTLPITMDANIRHSYGTVLIEATAHAMDETYQGLQPKANSQLTDVAVGAAAELTMKDFVTEPDSKLLIESAHTMVKVLASQLVMVHTKEAMMKSLGASIEKSLRDTANILLPLNFPFKEVAELMALENVQHLVKVTCDDAAKEAVTKLNDRLHEHISLREELKRTCEYVAQPAADLFEKLFPTHKHNKAFISKLSMTKFLIPAPVLHLHRQLYSSYGLFCSSHDAVHEMDAAFEKAMLLLNQHYRQSDVFLTLTKPEYMTMTFSDAHKEIRTITTLDKTIEGYNQPTLVAVVGHFCKKYLQNVLKKPPTDGNDSKHMIHVFYNELCLYILQVAVRRNPEVLTKEVTDQFIKCEDRWQLSDAACNLIGLGMVDMKKFDACLAEDLNRGASGAGPIRPPKETIDFVKTLVQRCVLDKRTIPQAAFRQTLEILQAVVRKNAFRVPSYVAFQPNGQAIREDMLRLYQKLEEIAKKKAASSPDKVQDDENALLKGLQQAGYLHDDKLDRCLTLLVEISVEAFSNDAARHPNDAHRVALEEARRRDESGKLDDSLLMKTKGRAAAPPPPPSVSIEQTPSLYRGVDAVHDLLMRLVKGCSWGETQGDGSAGLHLVKRVLSVVTAVLRNNHAFHASDPATASWTKLLEKNERPQASFYQQPYYRLLSNILGSISILGPKAASAAEPPAADASAKPASPHLNLFLQHYGDILLKLEPCVVPGFAFAWLDLLSHRLLLHRLVVHQPLVFLQLVKRAIHFLRPSLLTTQFSEPQRLFYKGLMKVMMVVTFDFPQFHYAHAVELCNVIPPMCFQLRNVVLSARARQQRPATTPTDMFKMDESKLPTPKPVAYVAGVLSESVGGVAPEYSSEDLEWVVRGHVTDVDQLVAAVVRSIRIERTPAEAAEARAAKQPGYSIPRVSAFITRLAELSVSSAEAPLDEPEVVRARAVHLLHTLLSAVDVEGKCLLLGSAANHLRDPNTHTFFYSRVMLALFKHPEATDDTQELIVTVLVERILEHTHLYLWGVLGTSTELMRNPEYAFWDKAFVKASHDNFSFEKFLRTLEKVTGGRSAMTTNNTEQKAAQPAPQATSAPAEAAAPPPQSSPVTQETTSAAPVPG